MGHRFGLKQINKPTPAIINLRMRIIVIVGNSIMGWMPTAPFIPNNIQNIITPIMSLGVIIFTAISPLYGVELDRKTVPVESVAAVKEETLKMIIFCLIFNSLLYSL